MSKSQSEFPSPKKLCRALHSGSDICDFQSRHNQLPRMVWITPNIDVWHKYTSSDTAATPSSTPALRSWVNIYRISIKTSAQLECSDRMTPAAARVSLTWKWYEIVYEQNFVWGNCLLNQRGPHYKFSCCCRRVRPVPSGCTSASAEQHTSRSRWCRDAEDFR